MKKKVVLICVFVAALLLAAALLILRPFGSQSREYPSSIIADGQRYLNEKYGYDVKSLPCIYARTADDSWHGDRLGFGQNFDVPNIAIYEYEGRHIVVTERNGFFGDDAQLEELNGLLSAYFTELMGLDTAFVEVRRSHNGNIKDETLNEVLHHSFNEKLTEENIGQFIDLLWQVDSLELIFYFKPAEDITAQVRRITTALRPLDIHTNLESLRFYILADEAMNIHYTPPRALTQTDDENGREPDEGYIWGHYHMTNDVEHFYPAGESSYYQNVTLNRFLVGGFCILDRGYTGGFGDHPMEKINGFGVVDLADTAFLEQYSQEMVNYGQHQGYTIFFRAGEEGDFSKLTIADGDLHAWDFRWGSGPIELYTFKHGRLLELKTAYECGYLSPADMDSILQVHKEYFSSKHKWNYDIEPGELSEELRAEIIACFPEWFGSGYNEKYDDADTIGYFQYYGTFSDYVILMYGGPCCMISEVEIGGRMFRWGSYPLDLFAYRDGQYRTVREAYEAGDLTDADLDAILQRHKEYFATIHNWDHDREG